MQKLLNKEIYITAIPIILSGIIITLSGIITTVIFSQLGMIVLSAAALISSIMNVVMALALGLFAPLAILVSHKMASGNDDQIKHLFISTLLIALIFGILSSCLMTNSYSLFVWLKQPIDSSKIAAQYFSALIYSIFPMLLTFVIGQLLLGLHKYKTSFVFTLLISLINILLMIILMKYYGVLGAAYASTISYVVALGAEIIYLLIMPEIRRLNLFKGRIRYINLHGLFCFGLPLSLQRSLEIFALTIMMFFMGRIGKSALCAQQTVMQIIFFLLIIPLGFMQTASILISKAVGKGNQWMIQYAAKRVILISSCFMFTALLIIWFLVIFDVRLLVKTEYSIYLLKMALITLLFDNVRYVINGVLRGLGDVKLPMLYTALGIWFVGIPASYVLAFIFQLGVQGLAIGWMCGVLVVMMLLLVRYHKILYSHITVNFSFS